MDFIWERNEFKFTPNVTWKEVYTCSLQWNCGTTNDGQKAPAMEGITTWKKATSNYKIVKLYTQLRFKGKLLALQQETQSCQANPKVQCICFI